MATNQSFNKCSYFTIHLRFVFDSIYIVLSLNIPKALLVPEKRIYEHIRNDFPVVNCFLLLVNKYSVKLFHLGRKKALFWFNFHPEENGLWYSYIEISGAIRMSPPRLCEDKYLTKKHFNG